ncbi:RNA/RNP complex-1-interacting phosphatase homolog [Drosophila innubila]|uniref:RNA/RNP complex-1-interacting phosphatase homolog n=1 Tax=Drosophila innubila TaxID=198719 RepID=UPI00148B6CB3|nr:RNA/RNP complex-1-interacting phosphatase homolog [Drosophila innubila]
MGKAIPDRWLNYQPIGQRVPATRFIAFKVPLKQNVNNTVDEELRLAPHSLLESVPNLGLIVDLTNTNRYYNPQEFRDQNVEHQKLMIPGHHTPPTALAQRFCDYVTNFLEANADNDKLIGVHCTHGVNRTGYLICYFMITQMNMSPKLAIQTFADARGHKIERENYTSSLLQLMQLRKRRNDSDNSQHVEGKRTKLPRHRHQDEQRSERSEGNWRQDQHSWQQQLQQQVELDNRRKQKLHQQEEHQNRRQQQEQRHQRYNQDRHYGHDDRSQQRPHRRWQDNERQESFNRKDNYNISYNQKPGNWQTRPSHDWHRDRNDDRQSYSRGNNNYNNYHNSRYNNNYGNNKYSWNSNQRQESGTSRNRFTRFNDQE